MAECRQCKYYEKVPKSVMDIAESHTDIMKA